MYNDIVLDHLSNPRNIGVLEFPDGIGQTGNASDGDKITVYIKVKNGIISDIKLKVFGCGAAIASGSMLTQLALGKTLAEAMRISNDDVASALGGLPQQKLLCSNTAATALHNAVKDYQMRWKE
ncbi:MAG TPA: iron-sulfur cluster assembly scaffold protein [Clostridia bacterium]|nr:iron-sulfur cluster assembly scaffold protein [Clostridia bacterium]